MDLLDGQPEFTKSIWDYLDILVNDARIENGRAILTQHRATFDAVEKAGGVDLLHRGDLGRRIQLRHPDRRALGDLLDGDAACIGRRQDFFREEFLSALEILARGDVTADHLKGSWAALSARPSSCRPRSSATPWISTAMAAATWSSRCRT